MNKDEVKKFANLARIEMSHDELVKMSGEIDAVLHYVDQIKTAVADSEELNIESATVRNVFREGDLVDGNKSVELIKQNRAQLLGEAPEIEGDYVKVKKIL